MKPNLIIIQPRQIASDSIVDRFCETLSETHYVYLVRPIRTILDDSPAGVRFLNYTDDRLPGFGEVESVIAVDSPEILSRLKDAYPAARHGLWNPDSDQAFPFALVPSLSETIIQGNFGETIDEPLAQAM